MPLTHRGREILEPRARRLAAEHRRRRLRDRPARRALRRLRHVRHELPVSGASERGDFFDVNQLLDAPDGSRRGELGAALRRLMQHEPDGPVEVPERVTVYRTIIYDDEKCLGCGTCARGCPADAIEARPPKADAAPAAPAATEGVPA